MKTYLPMLLLGITLLSGCKGDSSKNETDSRVQQLVGTWQEGDKGAFTLNSDGSFSGEVKTGSLGILVPKTIRLSGKWKLSGDFIVFHFEHSTHENERYAGMKVSEKLLDVDRNSFRSRDEKGKESVYTCIN